MTHELKILPEFFKPVALGHKNFEVRCIADRDFKVGDELILKEWDNGGYTGREIKRYISYVLIGDGRFGFGSDYAVLALKTTPCKAVLDTEGKLP